ncbi:hypothetical protein SLA2020_366600 [Shorea laevis]
MGCILVLLKSSVEENVRMLRCILLLIRSRCGGGCLAPLIKLWRSGVLLGQPPCATSHSRYPGCSVGRGDIKNDVSDASPWYPGGTIGFTNKLGQSALGHQSRIPNQLGDYVGMLWCHLGRGTLRRYFKSGALFLPIPTYKKVASLVRLQVI